jgi:hypothetical protein
LAGYWRPHPGDRAVRPRHDAVAPDDDAEFLNEINKKLRGEDKSG